MLRLKRDRATIGVVAGRAIIIGQMPERYTVSVLRGIQSAARVRQCNLLTSWGLGRINDPYGFHPAWPDLTTSSDFIPVGPWNTDGLIAFSPLGNDQHSSYLQQLSAQGFPVLYIATGDGEPSISVDNEAGIQKAMAHLVKDHGHLQIAFLAGNPSDTGDSEARLHAYRSAITEFDLSSDPRLVVYGWHIADKGYEATQELIASGVTFSALLASNDLSATGAMRAIREAGLEIPRDVAIIGFDDEPDAIAQTPPLTSVHVPLPEMGEQALVLMLDHILGNQALVSMRVPVRLRTRRSCGCMSDAVLSAADGSPRRQPAPGLPSARRNIRQAKRQLVEEMLAVLPADILIQDGQKIRHICAVLVQAFYTSLKKGSKTDFQKSLREFSNQMEMATAVIEPWQEIISALRREMSLLPVAWDQTHTRQLAEDMLHQVRVTISEGAQRLNYMSKYTQDIAREKLSMLTAGLSITLDEQQAIEFLATQLAAIDVRHARVALFEAEGDDPTAWSVIPNPQADSPAWRFPSREFPPPGLYPPDEILDLTLVPLVFQDESLGYIAFEGTNQESYALIARQLAAAIKTSRLYAQVFELSLTDPLTDLNNRRYFDLFLRKEVARSYRYRHPLAVIMLDIDHFKRYNDAFGHPAGDRALQAVAHCIQSNRRRTDVAARIGGEEFALILPDTDTEGAQTVAEKIRAAVSDLSHLESPISLSAGVRVLQGGAIEEEIIVQQADLALYEAKRTGRDQVCVFKE